MKDLEQLEKKNKEAKTSSAVPLKKKVSSTPQSSGEKRPVNLSDKIKELEDRLFGSK